MLDVHEKGAQVTQPWEMWLRIRLTPGMNRTRFYSLMECVPNPEAVLGASAQDLSYIRGIDSELIRALLSQKHHDLVRQELELMQQHNVRLLSQDDPEYPQNLRNSSVVAPLLYIRGKLQASDRYALALVGSRSATTYGKMIAEDFASRLARLGITVVSGFARGIDAAAHGGALAVGGRTLAILGCGLSVCYPAENRGLGQRIAERGGALLSEYPMRTPPDRFNFPERNRIIATVSLGTVVVEAAEKSGALITAREALDEGRGVYAVPGDITRQNSKGSNALIGAGARLIQRPDDALLDLIGQLRAYLKEDQLEPSWQPGDPKVATPRAARPGTTSDISQTSTITAATDNPGPVVRTLPTLNEQERAVVDLLLHEPCYFDTLLASLDAETFPINRLSSVLLQLELKKVIRQMPGRLYAILN